MRRTRSQPAASAAFITSHSAAALWTTADFAVCGPMIHRRSAYRLMWSTVVARRRSARIPEAS
jgi:hypothetical protein